MKSIVFDVNKLQNFWYYNKGKIIAAFIVIIVVAIIFSVNGKNIAPDVQIAYITDGRMLPEEVIENINEYLAPQIIDVNKDKNRVIAFVPLTGPMIDLELFSDDSQVILMDRNTLEKYINSGVLEPVDEMADKFNLDFSQNPEVRGENEIHYAIPLKCIPFLIKAGFPSDDYYLAVRTAENSAQNVKDKNRNAHAILNVILQD